MKRQGLLSPNRDRVEAEQYFDRVVHLFGQEWGATAKCNWLRHHQSVLALSRLDRFKFVWKVY
jgi:hypothetical protein